MSDDEKAKYRDKWSVKQSEIRDKFDDFCEGDQKIMLESSQIGTRLKKMKIKTHRVQRGTLAVGVKFIKFDKN